MNTAALLEDLGHYVITASSAAEALDATRAHPDLDLLITDYAMPNINGLELAKSMAEHLPGLPVIFATGYADAKIFEDKGTRVLNKPFTQKQLRNAIMSVIDDGARAYKV